MSDGEIKTMYSTTKRFENDIRQSGQMTNVQPFVAKELGMI